jgi:hypothetical protein
METTNIDKSENTNDYTFSLETNGEQQEIDSTVEEMTNVEMNAQNPLDNNQTIQHRKHQENKEEIKDNGHKECNKLSVKQKHHLNHLT